jgi:hypothetical protein
MLLSLLLSLLMLLLLMFLVRGAPGFLVSSLIFFAQRL